MVDLTGKEFGGYRVVRFDSYDKHRNRRWICLCLGCQNEFRVFEVHLVSRQSTRKRQGCAACSYALRKARRKGCKYCGKQNSQNRPVCRTCAWRRDISGICPDCNFPRYAKPKFSLAETKDGRCLCPASHPTSNSQKAPGSIPGP